MTVSVTENELRADTPSVLTLDAVEVQFGQIGTALEDVLQAGLAQLGPGHLADFEGLQAFGVFADGGEQVVVDEERLGEFEVLECRPEGRREGVVRKGAGARGRERRERQVGQLVRQRGEVGRVPARCGSPDDIAGRTGEERALDQTRTRRTRGLLSLRRLRCRRRTRRHARDAGGRGHEFESEVGQVSRGLAEGEAQLWWRGSVRVPRERGEGLESGETQEQRGVVQRRWRRWRCSTERVFRLVLILCPCETERGRELIRGRVDDGEVADVGGPVRVVQDSGEQGGGPGLLLGVGEEVVVILEDEGTCEYAACAVVSERAEVGEGGRDELAVESKRVFEDAIEDGRGQRGYPVRTIGCHDSFLVRSAWPRGERDEGNNGRENGAMNGVRVGPK